MQLNYLFGFFVWCCLGCITCIYGQWYVYLNKRFPLIMALCLNEIRYSFQHIMPEAFSITNDRLENSPSSVQKKTSQEDNCLQQTLKITNTTSVIGLPVFTEAAQHICTETK